MPTAATRLPAVVSIARCRRSALDTLDDLETTPWGTPSMKIAALREIAHAAERRAAGIERRERGGGVMAEAPATEPEVDWTAAFIGEPV